MRFRKSASSAICWELSCSIYEQLLLSATCEDGETHLAAADDFLAADFAAVASAVAVRVACDDAEGAVHLRATAEVTKLTMNFSFYIQLLLKQFTCSQHHHH